MKKLLAIFLSLVIFVSCFCGCNSNTPEKENVEPVKERPEPVAQISPEEIDPGRQKDAVYTSDLWYPDKNDGSYFYLQKTDVISITFVNGTEKETYTCSVSDDKHLIADGEVCNIVFYDAFNCYDFVKKEWYTRGDAEKIKAYFSGKTFVNVNDEENMYIFGEDNVITEIYKGTEYEGVWSLIAETVITITFGKDDYYYTFDIDLDSDGNVLGLSQRGGRTFRIKA